MSGGIRRCLLLIGLIAATAVSAAPAHKAKHPPAPSAPAEPPGPGWVLDKGHGNQTLFYGMPDGTDTVIAFDCAPRGGDVVISVPEASGKARPDENQTVSLTIGGVRSSFAGRVVEDPKSGALALNVTVTARNVLFTSLGGPGGLRIEGKGFSKAVPLRGIGPKLSAFVGACRRG